MKKSHLMTLEEYQTYIAKGGRSDGELALIIIWAKKQIGESGSIVDAYFREVVMRGKLGPMCGRCPYFTQSYVGGRGSGKTMLVGDGPGQTDAKSGRAFSGRTGLRLEKALRSAGIRPDMCRYTNAVACHVPKSRAPTKRALECCRPLLEVELADYRPQRVITLGESALKAFYPGRLRDHHGLRIKGDGYTLIPMYKPDAGDKSPELMKSFVNDFWNFKHRPLMRRLEGDYRRVGTYTRSSTLTAVDTETTGLDLRSRIVGIGVCDSPGDAVYMSKEAGIDSLWSWPPERTVMHNAKYDLAVFESNGLPMTTFGEVEDTMLLAYVMNKKPLGLKGLVLQELNLEMRFFKDVLGSRSTFEQVPEEEAVQYGCSDPDGTLRLWNKLWREADRRERRLYELVEKPLPAISARIQLDGVLVDVPYLKRLQGQMNRQIATIVGKITTGFKVDIDTLNSPQRLSHYLYQELKLPVPYRTESGAPSTEHDALERLKGKHPFIDLLLEYRRLAKLKSTFVDGLLTRQTDGLVFPDFNQVGTTTGRPSSSNPNMQNLPKRQDKTIRKAFIAPEGHVVVSLDNSQIDLRVLAYESRDAALMEIFERDLDVHKETSMSIYGDAEEGHRRTAKTANFLVIFGGGSLALATKAGIQADEAQRFLDGWWARHSGVRRWVDRTHRFALENGYAETWMGRRRHVPKVFTGQRAAGLREIQNAPIQGGSTDVLKLQMSAVAPVCLPFSQVHDELDFYVRADVLMDTARELKERMEGIECPFKLKVEVSAGPSLGELKKLEV